MDIIDQLKRDEGFRSSAYRDHLGYLTIGIGRLIDERRKGGISEDEAEYLLENDIRRVTSALRSTIPWIDGIDSARRGVLVNMAFQLGVNGLLAFKRTLAHVQAGSYAAAASEMLQSDWAKQTTERAERLATQMMTGIWQ